MRRLDPTDIAPLEPLDAGWTIVPIGSRWLRDRRHSPTGGRRGPLDGSSTSTDELHERICAPARYKLEVGMPHPDGLEVCRRLPGVGNATPILLLSAHDIVVGRVAGLTAGAGDSLGKPFAAQDLVARPHALLRRRRVPRLLHDVGDGGSALQEDW